MLGCERYSAGTLEGVRQMPWIRTLGCLVRRDLVIRLASLPVKPAMAMVDDGIMTASMDR